MGNRQVLLLILCFLSLGQLLLNISSNIAIREMRDFQIHEKKAN